MSSSRDTIPSSREQGPTEQQPLRIDVSNWLDVGESPSAPSATLVEHRSGISAGTLGTPSVDGNVITVAVSGLTAGVTYRLEVTFTAAAGKVWTTRTLIVCTA